YPVLLQEGFTIGKDIYTYFCRGLYQYLSRCCFLPGCRALRCCSLPLHCMDSALGASSLPCRHGRLKTPPPTGVVWQMRHFSPFSTSESVLEPYCSDRWLLYSDMRQYMSLLPVQS